MKLLRSLLAVACLLLVGVAGAGAADDWQRIHGKVQSVSGNTVTVKADDGRVLTVDAAQVSADIRGALAPGAGVTLIGKAGAQSNQFTAQYIQQDASDPLRGGTIVGQTPPAVTDRSWQRVHGTVQSVSVRTLAAQFAKQPRASIRPVAVSRCARNAKGVGCLLDRKSCEIAQSDKLRFYRVLAGEFG